MKNRNNQSVWAIMLLLLVSCNDIFEPRIMGSGEIVTEDRDVGVFNKIILEGNYEITIIQGSEHSLEIEGDDNIIPVIQSRISGDELKVFSRRNFKASDRIKLLITVENIRSLSLRGSTSVSSEDNFYGEHLDLDLSGSGSVNLNISYESFDANISGSGSFYLQGDVNRQEISISGSGHFYGTELASSKAETSISGSGHIYVHAEEHLKIRISGSGNIYYYGSPEVDSSVSGSGNIIKKE